MSEDRINALLTLGGGILVFAAALIPIIRSLVAWVKRPEISSKAKFWTSVLFPSILPIPAYFLIVFSQYRIIGLLLLIIFVCWQVTDFLRATGPITRLEIVAFCAFPMAYFAFMYGMFSYYHMADEIEKIQKQHMQGFHQENTSKANKPMTDCIINETRININHFIAYQYLGVYKFHFYGAECSSSMGKII